ncbi:uncharacterized protein LOC106377762 [Brassica napus]|uniref:uncharacterized protein LOC106377762 n=1 Tax=Brassica napus TaxID=3708 RepID=UPI0006AB1F98|nr:uncharacterized protein LOC106377762 [Brassica napus]
MQISLSDMKPLARSLTGFNGSSEMVLGTILLRVHAQGVTKTIKFSVVDVRTPYNAILGTPWIHAMKAIPSTYHQCAKLLGNDGRVITLRGDQAAAGDLLIAEEEIFEIIIDEHDPSKTVRVGTYLSDETKDQIIAFMKENISTFAWSTNDMKGIDPNITTHELNVDPTFKPVRQKRRKLGPK